jgi:hypothetical protein
MFRFTSILAAVATLQLLAVALSPDARYALSVRHNQLSVGGSPQLYGRQDGASNAPTVDSVVTKSTVLDLTVTVSGRTRSLVVTRKTITLSNAGGHASTTPTQSQSEATTTGGAFSNQVAASPSQTASTSSAGGKNKRVSNVAIGGIIAGVCIGIGIVSSIIWFTFRRLKRRGNTDPSYGFGFGKEKHRSVAAVTRNGYDPNAPPVVTREVSHGSGSGSGGSLSRWHGATEPTLAQPAAQAPPLGFDFGFDDQPVTPPYRPSGRGSGHVEPGETVIGGLPRSYYPGREGSGHYVAVALGSPTSSPPLECTTPSKESQDNAEDRAVPTQSPSKWSLLWDKVRWGGGKRSSGSSTTPLRTTNF